MTNWANVLTWSRLVLVLPATLAAFFGMRLFVLGFFVLMLLTDVLDGYVARKTGTASQEGAAFDSLIDNLTLPFLFLWLVLLFPKTIRGSLWLLIIFIVLLLSQLVLARVKLGKLTGLHLYSDKASATVGGLTVICLFLFGENPITVWLWSLALIVSIIAFLDGHLYLLKGGKNLDARFFWDK